MLVYLPGPLHPASRALRAQVSASLGHWHWELAACWLSLCRSSQLLLFLHIYTDCVYFPGPNPVFVWSQSVLPGPNPVSVWSQSGRPPILEKDRGLPPPWGLIRTPPGLGPGNVPLPGPNPVHASFLLVFGGVRLRLKL